MFAIARVAKVKSLDKLKQIGAHNTRKVHVPNASGDKKVLVLAGSHDPAADVAKLLPQKVRKNAVLAIEHMLTASPEYFRPDNPGAAGTYDQSRLDAWRDRVIQWLNERYGANLAHAVLHLDESTPHIHAIVVPRRSDGKLDAAKLFGPDQLRDMQTSYAKALESLGLQRGIEGSKAQHQTIKRYYALINAPAQEVPQVTTPQPRQLPRKTIAEYIPGTAAYKRRKEAEAKREAQLEKRAHEIRARQKFILQNAESLIAKSKLYDATAKSGVARENALRRLRKDMAIIRDIPISNIFELFGCTPNKRDKKRNWDTPMGRISTDGQKFYNHDAGVGGGGAIDLVMHLGGMSYHDAVAYLSAHFGRDEAVSAALHRARDEAVAASKKHVSAIPQASDNPSHLLAVKKYLTQERQIPEQIVDTLIKKGKIYAVQTGKYINAAFPFDDNSGVELRGISGKYHGVRGKKSLFTISTSNNPRKAVFVESAIEAMSYWALDINQSVKIISTTGSSSETLIGAIRDEISKGREVVLAFNRDGKGPNRVKLPPDIADKMRVEKPSLGNDWNDDLRMQTVNASYHSRLRPGC